MVVSNSNVRPAESRDSFLETKTDNVNIKAQNGKRRGRPRVDVEDKTSADVSLVYPYIFQESRGSFFF